MKYIEVEPILLKIKGGWINPAAILTVETYRPNEAMLTIRLTGMEHPIVLNETDSAYVNKYLDSRTWPLAEHEQQGFVADKGTP